MGDFQTRLKLIFGFIFLDSGIRGTKFWKVKNFQEWVAQGYFEWRAKKEQEAGAYSAPAYRLGH